MRKDNNNIVIRLLLSPQLRIVRHILLFVCVLFISAGNIWGAEDAGIELSSLDKYGGLLFFTLIIITGCYLNIYVLTPLLLLKNRWGLFFFYLFLLALLVLIAYIALASVYGIATLDTTSGSIEYFQMMRGLVNLSSAMLAFFVLLAGTSSFVLLKKWIVEMQEAEELESATLQMELKLLENQINPHFLFNMINNANIMIKKGPDIAVHIIGKLEEMLRYLMNESVRDKVCLRDEIAFTEDFLELEKTRRDHFHYTVFREGDVDSFRIAPLLFITFVENAVKHNSHSDAASYVYILFKNEKGRLIFVCENSIPRKTTSAEVGGIGLANINRRLNLLYKNSYSLEQSATETSYTVKLELSL